MEFPLHPYPTFFQTSCYVKGGKKKFLSGLIPYDLGLCSFKIKVFENCNSQMIHPESITVNKGIEPKEIFH